MDSPRGQQVTDGVPGTDEDLGLVAPQHHGFVLRDLNVSVHLHQVGMVVWRDARGNDRLQSNINNNSETCHMTLPGKHDRTQRPTC